MASVPKWLEKKIDQNGLFAVREAVSHAELKTSAEIVPMIVRRSSAIGHVPFFLGLLLAFIFLDSYHAGFTSERATSLGFSAATYSILEAVGAVVFAGLGYWLAHREWAQRLLVPAFDQHAQVEDRAELEFYRSNIRSTHDSTGILIFVSMLERKAVILADKAIADRFPPKTWTEIIEGLLKRIKDGDLAGGFEWAIRKSGELVAPYFPVQPNDANELSNDLIIKD